MSDSKDHGPLSPEKAAAQAAEFLGVLAGVDFDLGGGATWHLPNPSYMQRDMRRRYNEHLRFINKDLQKEEITDPVTGKKREQTIWPLQFNNELIDEDELLCVALMDDGEDGGVAAREAYLKDGTFPDTYKKFMAAGGVAGQVQVHWRVMSLQMEERVQRDPFRR